jgi:hypothetical protein
MRKDLIFGTSIVESFAAGTTTGNGTAVDLNGSYAAKHVVSCDAFTADITLKLQDSPDNSVWTDVAASKMIGGANSLVFTATGKDQIGGFDLQRYQRLVYVSGTGTVSADAELANRLAD